MASPGGPAKANGFEPPIWGSAYGCGRSASALCGMRGVRCWRASGQPVARQTSSIPGHLW
eukprot:scaffold24753_cov108-Isochrysis_galbana.AAC.4